MLPITKPKCQLPADWNAIPVVRNSLTAPLGRARRPVNWMSPPNTIPSKHSFLGIEVAPEHKVVADLYFHTQRLKTESSEALRHADRFDSGHLTLDGLCRVPKVYSALGIEPELR